MRSYVKGSQRISGASLDQGALEGEDQATMKSTHRWQKRSIASRLRGSAAAAALLFLLGGLSPVLAQSTASEAPPRYRVFLLTADQGEEVWELFGHNAILIVDNLTGERLAWNWGLFNFGDADFLPRFLKGTMRYTMGPADVDAFLYSYAAAGRGVYSNEIFLTEVEATSLDGFIRNNYLPENRPYIYHYFRDNCSTRVRDALDGVLGGLLQERFADRMTPQSYRWHSRRLVQVEGWVDQGLSFLLGTKGDYPITEWEAMFAPLELMKLLEGVERIGANGQVTPLLGPRVTVVESVHEGAPPAPPGLSPIWPLLGLLLATGLSALAFAGSRGAGWGRIGAYLGIAAWGLFSGLLGLLLLMAWFTDHEFIRWNLNIFYLSPLGLVLALGAIALILPRRWEGGTFGRAVRGCSLLIAILSLGIALLQITPLLAQGNAEVLTVALPLNLSVAWGLRTLHRAQQFLS